MPTSPVIVAAKRTPVGKFLGAFSRTPAPRIGSLAIGAVLGDAPDAKDHIDECIMGCVLQAGLGQNPARQAALGAGLPHTLNAKTVNKVCGSGLEAVMTAAQSIKAGDNHAVIAGGFENMTLAPHLAYIRQGVKFGPATMLDHMDHDGLRCAFENWAMGHAAEHIAEKYAITREDQDRLGARSHQLAAAAWDKGYFDAEIVTLTGEQLGNRKAPGPEGGIQRDEGIRVDSTPETLAKLRPAFDQSGTVTAGNASQISDGAAATIVMSAEKAGEIGIDPLCTVVSYHTAGVEPKDIFAAPIQGVRGALDKAGWSIDDVDLFEINEAFAAQLLCNAKELGIDEDKLNICGGGVAIGHPIGASGARTLVTLIHQMIRVDAKKGVAALCLGGGNAVAMCIER